MDVAASCFQVAALQNGVSFCLDEGVDVPACTVGVLLAGGGSKREFTQRLGRLLRPTDDGNRAILDELVSEETAEDALRVVVANRGGQPSERVRQ